MRGLVGALLLVPALALQIVQRNPDPELEKEHSATSDLEIASSHLAIYVPTQSPDDTFEEETIGLKLEVLNSDAPCGYGNVTIDGQVLPQKFNDGISSGKGSITTEQQTIVLASWDFYCVKVNGLPDSQLMKFVVDTINGKAVQDVGLVILFRQTGPTEILSVDDLSAPMKIIGNPSPDLLQLVDEEEHFPEFNIEEEMAELDYLWAQMRELKFLIHEKERAIAHQSKHHFGAEDFGDCDSLKCIAKTVAKHAKHAIHSVFRKIHVDESFDSFDGPHVKKPKFPKFPKNPFKHGPKKNCTHGRPKHGNFTHPPKGNHTHPPHWKRPLPICRYPPPPPHHGKPPPPPPHGHRPPPPPEFDSPPPHHHEGPPDFNGPPPHHGDGPDDGHPPQHHGDGPHFGSGFEKRPKFDGRPPKHHGDRPHDGPPEFDGPPRHHGGPHEGPDFDEPPHHKDHFKGPPGHEKGPVDGLPDFDTPFPPPHHGDHHGPPGGPEGDVEGALFRGPRHGPPPHRGAFRALRVLKFSAIGFLFAFLVIALHRRACNPQSRASRQARREERHRRRAYRRAAHKHVITRILARMSGHGSDDKFDDEWEEKRAAALLANAEDGMSTTMTEEITEFRNAAEVVGEIAAADEHTSTIPVPVVTEPISIPASESRPLLRDFDMSSQVGDGEELPAYEDNDGSENSSVIADGFRYTPGSSEYSPSGSMSDILGSDTKS